MVAIVRDRQREETRRRLYVAALQVFRRDGVGNCRIDDIAKIAEVSRAAFYFHFPTKDDVLIELLRESEKPISEAIAALKNDTPVDKVLALGRKMHITGTPTTFFEDGERVSGALPKDKIEEKLVAAKAGPVVEASK